MPDSEPQVQPWRVLVTGSREWVDRGLVAAELALLPPGSTVFHGACHLGGADLVAGEVAKGLGLLVRPVPVDHALDGPWPAAGPRRNQRMLATHGPFDLVLAFHEDPTLGRGTRDMVRRAKSDLRAPAGARIVTVVRLPSRVMRTEQFVRVLPQR